MSVGGIEVEMRIRVEVLCKKLVEGLGWRWTLVELE